MYAQLHVAASAAEGLPRAQLIDTTLDPSGTTNDEAPADVRGGGGFREQGQAVHSNCVLSSARAQADDHHITATNAPDLTEVSGGAPAFADPSSLVDRSDAGNCAKLIEIAGGDLRWVRERRTWLHWDGKRWTPDEAGSAATLYALRVAAYYFDMAADYDQKAADPACPVNDKERLRKVANGCRTWATKSRDRGRIDAMLALAARDVRIVIGNDMLDRDPWLLGVDNGVVDLRTGQLRPAARNDFVTRRCRVAYKPAAAAPRWAQFIDEITAAPIAAERDAHTGEIIPSSVGRIRLRSDLARYLRKLVGYLLTGATAEHKLFVFRGDGANGKSVLLDVVRHVAGDYWVNTAAEVLTATRLGDDAERASPAVARLAGARAALASETKDGTRLDAAVIKTHTGERALTARFLHRDPFTFPITHKIVLSTNHEPALDHLDDALRGRLHIVPFDRQWNRPGHAERNPALRDGDKGLMDTLMAEAEGILASAVQGAVLYHQEGLEPPAEVVGRTREFLADGDSLGRWLATCTRCDPKAGMRSSEALQAFRHWCNAEGIAPGITTPKGFSAEVVRRGVQRSQIAAGSVLGIQAAADSLLVV